MGDDQQLVGPCCHDLREELLRRRDVDQAARSALGDGDQAAFARLLRIDDDNAAWLEKVIAMVGWPGRSLVGDEGAHAAWLLAQHADRYPTLQRRCLKLLEEAVAVAEASPADRAYLMDRVLLASGEFQIYGTQMAARDGRLVACRLRDPDTVDERRTSVGLGPLGGQLRRALDLFGPPTPASMRCPSCHGQLEVWLPELGGHSTVTCPACHAVATIRPCIRGTQPPRHG